MWESLGSSRRQDVALHGMAKALNLVVGLMALPLWLAGQWLSDPFRRLLARLDTDPGPLPVLPTESVAVHAISCVPSPEIVSGALALVVPSPAFVPSCAPLHAMSVTLLPKIDTAAAPMRATPAIINAYSTSAAPVSFQTPYLLAARTWKRY